MFFDVIRKKFRQITNRNDRPRVVIIHNHIFKNAGSSIDWALRRNFGSGFVDHRDDDSMRQGAKYLEHYLRKKPRVTALSTHHLVKPLPSVDEIDLKEIMMLRHPIERVASVYHFERKQVIDIPGTVYARKSSLKDYIIWRMRPEVGATIRNFHVRKMLPPRKIGQERIEESEMKAAQEQLDQMDLMGLVEHFDESMVLFEEKLREFFPKIDLSYVAQNIGQEKKHGLSGKLHELEQEIGQETYDLLLENNQRDMELYIFVVQAFEKRIAAIPLFDEKLSAFRARCDKLREELERE